MERARQIRELWNWLPAFRVVAETEHLPTAAEAAHVSASALSRAIGLLEDELGVKLFERAGRRISLNSAGKSLLAAVREAMRRVDDGIAELKSDVPRGPLRLACCAELRELVALPAALSLRSTHAELVPRIETMPADPQSALLQGRIDIAITLGIEPDDRGVEVADRGSVDYAVFCGPAHPLLGGGGKTEEPFEDHGFAAAPGEPWPASISRRVVLWCDEPAGQVVAVRDHGLLALLPRALGTARQLALVPVAIDASRDVTVLRRRVIGPAPAVDAALDAIEDHLAAAGAAAPEAR